MLATVVAVVFVACKKDKDTQQNVQNAEQSSFVNFKGFNVKVQENDGKLGLRGGNWLYFQTREDYENAIEVLATSPNDEILPVFEKAVSFNSMRVVMSKEEREEIEIEDDVLATILNSNGVIQIGNYLFQIDVYNDVALVYDLTKDAKPAKYSTMDDFFSIIDGKDAKYNNYCDAKNKKNNVEVSGLSINSKVVYQHALVYFSLLTRIEKNKNESYLKMQLQTSNDSYYCKNGDNYQRHDLSNHLEGPGYNKTYEWRPYHGGKRCVEFKFKVTFTAIPDNNPYNPVVWPLTITCGE